MPVRPAALQLKLLEPVIFLRSSGDTLEGLYDRPVARDESGPYEHIDENLNQLRGLVTIEPEGFTSIRGPLQVRIRFHGVSVWIDKSNKFTQNHLRDIVSYTVTIPIDVSEGVFDTGSSSLPFSIPVSSNLPPTLDADLGSNRYAVSAELEGPGLTKSITAEVPVRLDCALVETRSRDTGRAEGMCYDDLVQYAWSADEQVCIGAQLSMGLSLLPVTQDNLSIAALHLLLEESTTFSAVNVSDKPTIKRWPLARLQSTSPNKLLPWTGHTGCSEVDTAILSAGHLYHEQEQSSTKSRATNAEEIESKVRGQLGSVNGPWNLSWQVRLPSCSNTAINNTIQHPQSIVTVTHCLVLQILFQGPGKDQAAIELTRPIVLLSSYLAEEGSILPCYYCDNHEDHPHMANDTWRQVAEQEMTSISSTKLPKWLLRQNAALRKSISKEAQSPNLMQTSKEWLNLSSQENDLMTAGAHEMNMEGVTVVD